MMNKAKSLETTENSNDSYAKKEEDRDINFNKYPFLTKKKIHASTDTLNSIGTHGASIDEKNNSNNTTKLKRNIIDLINFYPCETISDFNTPQLGFHPLFSHHFFDDEKINLNDTSFTIQIFYTPDTFDAYLRIKIDNEKSGNHTNTANSSEIFFYDTTKNLSREDVDCQIDHCTKFCSKKFKFDRSSLIQSDCSVTMNNKNTKGYADRIFSKNFNQPDNYNSDHDIPKRKIKYYDLSNLESVDSGKSVSENMDSNGTNNSDIFDYIIHCLLKKIVFPGGFCKTPDEFLSKIYENRNFEFAPPGCVIDQCKLNDSMFEIRECSFGRIKKHQNNVDPVLGNKNTPLIDHSDLQLLKSCQHESDDFTNLSVENYPSKSNKSIQNEFDVDVSAFSLLHRRIEWFLHWFIESASSIDQEDRWRVVLAYMIKFKDKNISEFDADKISRFQEQKRRILLNCVEGSVRNFFTERVKRNDSVETPCLTTFTAEKNPGMDVPLKKHNNEEISSSLHSDSSETSLPSLLNDSRIEEFNNEAIPRHLLHAVKYHLLGFSTTYTFFTLNKDRRRISQFMVFPHMQNKGVGMKLLESIYHQVIIDDDVAEMTVEDPAPSFTQLRDVVSLKLCFDLNLLPKSLLYPPNYFGKLHNLDDKGTVINSFFTTYGDFKLYSGRTLPSRKLIISVIKESARQATKVQDALRLAQIMPEPMLPPPRLLFNLSDDSDYLSRDWRQANFIDLIYSGNHSQKAQSLNSISDDTFCESDECKNLRVHVKKRIWREYLDDLTEISATGIRMELDRRWKEHYAGLYRTIRKVRATFVDFKDQHYPTILL